MRALWTRAAVTTIQAPFRAHDVRATRWSATACDRPDLRYGLEITDVTRRVRRVRADVRHAARIDGGGRVRGIRVPGGATLSRKQLDELEAVAKAAGAGGLIVLEADGRGLRRARRAKFLGPTARPTGSALRRGRPWRCSSPRPDARGVAGARPRAAGARAAARISMQPDELEFLWVVDFPMFERDAAHRRRRRRAPSVHGAASRRRATCSTTDPRRRARSRYDVVLNGTELGGGSIRITDPARSVARVRAARHRRRDGAGAVRLPARGAARRRAAARRHRVRLRPDRHAARRRARRCATSSRSRRPPPRARCSRARRRRCQPRISRELHIAVE